MLHTARETTILKVQIHVKLKKYKNRDCLGFRNVSEDQSHFHMVQKVLGGDLTGIAVA